MRAKDSQFAPADPCENPDKNERGQVSMTRADPGRSVRIPFKVVDGALRYFYGGKLPELREGTIGEVVVPRSALTDDAERNRLDQERTERFLAAGTLILMRMRAAVRDAKRKGCRLDPLTDPFEGGMFVEVLLTKDLSLRLRGSKPAALEPVECAIPALGDSVTATSLNHAYRLISEVFEPTRVSHAGNVFHEAFAQGEKAWVPLGRLRSAVEARFEDQLRPTPTIGRLQF